MLPLHVYLLLHASHISFLSLFFTDAHVRKSSVSELLKGIHHLQSWGENQFKRLKMFKYIALKLP